MTGYIQRFPFAPKATWFKRYIDQEKLNTRIVYVATQNLGFEIHDVAQYLNPVSLSNGEIKCEENVKYIKITREINGEIKPTKAILLLGRLYMFNNLTQTMEEEDIIEEGIEIIKAETDSILRIESNNYLRKFSFDCIKEKEDITDTRQYVSGLTTKEGSITLKTHNFSCFNDLPSKQDLVQYQGKLWVIVNSVKSCQYTAREKTILHLTIKQLEKQKEESLC